MTLNTDVLDRSPLPFDTWMCPICGYRILREERKALSLLGCPQCNMTTRENFEFIGGDGRDDV